jgi:probable phosphoglycerate mutase
MQKTIYFIRHGQTQWNLEHRIQGQKNSSLTVKGQEDAQKAAHFLQSLGIEKLYCSTAGRAIETAAIIRETLQLPAAEINPLLCEQNFGVYEGKTIESVEALLGHAFFSWDDPKQPLEGGESLYTAGQRLLQFLEYLRIQPENTIAAVSHGSSLRSLTWQLMPETSPAIYTYENGSVAKLIMNNDNITLAYWGKVSQ